MGCGSSKSTGANETGKRQPEKNGSVVLETSPSPLQQPLDAEDKCVDEASCYEHQSEHHQELSSSQEFELEAGENFSAAENCEVFEDKSIHDVEETDFHPFPEFPTPQLLREANQQYSELRKTAPVDENKRLLPFPSRSYKKEIFTLDDHKQIDEHALTTPAHLATTSMNNLVRHLCSVAVDDISKVRILFRWLTAQDISTIDVEKYRDTDSNSAMAYMVKIKEDTGDYSILFVDMCRAADMQAERVTGLVKTSDYQLGKDVPESSKGSWAAVVIDNQWRLFDPHWSARHVTGGDFGEWELIDDNGQGAKKMEATEEETMYKHNEAYFLTDPEEMVYSHMPQKGEDWQMLARPVTKSEFNQMAYLKPAFFQLDLELKSHRKCCIEANDGEIEIEFGLPLKRRRFMYRLWVSNKEGEGHQLNVNELKLDRFVFMQQLKQRLNVRVSFPQAGKFKLELYCRDAEKDTPGTDMYGMACTYIIYTDKAKDEIQPLPENNRKEWGPGLDLHLSGLYPESHKEAVIEAENGMAQIKMKADKYMELLHELHSNTKTKDELKDYVVHEVSGENVTLFLKVPERGEYALNLFAKEADSDGTFPNVCSYLVTSDQGAFDADPFPRVTNGRLGATDTGSKIGVKSSSHSTSFIEAPDSGELEFVLELPAACTLSSHLQYRQGSELIDMDKYHFMSQDKNKATFKMQFPESGYYSLTIYGEAIDKEGQTLPNIYNVIIHAPQPKEKCLPFPKAFTIFGSSQASLHFPTEGQLQCNKKVNFRATVPGASRVATISSKGWTHLEKDEEGIWVGVCEVGEADTQLKLSAEMAEGSNSYDTLILYDVKEENDIDLTLKKQQEAKEKAERLQEEERERREKRQQDIEKTKKELLEAMRKRDMKAIKQLLQYIDKKRYVSHLKIEVEEAKDLLKSLERIAELNKTILNMDAATMAEIRRYANPPRVVHEVMVASLLLLGDHEGKSRNWKNCQKLCVGIGEHGLIRRVKDFKIEKLHPEIAARGRFLLSRFRLDDVNEKSAGAATFYAWTVGMCEEMRLMRKTAAQPASVARQKEIFNKKQGKNSK